MQASAKTLISLTKSQRGQCLGTIALHLVVTWSDDAGPDGGPTRDGRGRRGPVAVPTFQLFRHFPWRFVGLSLLQHTPPPNGVDAKPLYIPRRSIETVVTERYILGLLALSSVTGIELTS